MANITESTEFPKNNEPNENKDLAESPSIVIDREGFNGSTQEIESVLEKYDIPSMVSDITGLGWKTDSLKLKHIEKSAEWEGTDTALVNLGSGAYGASGVAHELVHLSFRQNKWLENPKISEFIDKYPEMREWPKTKKGYPIEQMIAYLVQDEISKKIGQEEGIDKLVQNGGHGSFEHILDNEYDTETKKGLGNKILDKWPERKNYPDVIKWIESIIDNFEEEA